VPPNALLFSGTQLKYWPAFPANFGSTHHQAYLSASRNASARLSARRPASANVAG
jgi:hypothetical protein